MSSYCQIHGQFSDGFCPRCTSLYQSQTGLAQQLISEVQQSQQCTSAPTYITDITNALRRIELNLNEIMSIIKTDK